MKLLVIIPAYNESGSIERVVNCIRDEYPQYDYVVVNDGSVDDTAGICRRNGYRLIDLKTNLGLAGAFQAGVKYAWENDYDCAIQIDGDGQHDPAYIEGMAALMQETDADIVIGSRFVEKKKPGGLRMFGSNIIATAIRLTTGKLLRDPTSGMRLLNRRMIREFAVNMNYGPEPDTVSYLMRNGAKVEEYQVEMRERTAGKSYLSAWRSVEYMVRIVISIVLIQPFRKRSTT